MTSFAPRSKTNWQSWHALWPALPLLLIVLFFAKKAFGELDTAGRQQINSATIANCERSGKSGYSCVYLFSFGKTDYQGRDYWGEKLLYGEAVNVYYDTQHPARNSLHDFYETGRKNLLFTAIPLLMAFAIFARILYAKTKARRALSEL